MSYKCACYAYLNLYLEKYGFHFRYFNHSQFIQDYHQLLKARKCSDEEINEISQTLKNLQNSKKQEDIKALERFQKIKSLYKPLHPKIFKLSEEFLEDSFKRLVDACRTGDREMMMERRHPDDEVDVFTLPVFTKHFIQLFMQEIDHMSTFEGIQLGRPNSMNHNGVLMKELGMDDFLTELREKYLQPLVDSVFGHSVGLCDSHRAFTVKYSFDGSVDDGTGDKRLGKHYDNSEVTLNVCMQQDKVAGSELVFMGMANSDNSEEDRFTLTHELGQGILHLGQLKHYVTPIESGVRTNLVLWLRSSEVRNKQCPMCWDVPEIVKTSFVDDGFRP